MPIFFGKNATNSVSYGVLPQTLLACLPGVEGLAVPLQETLSTLSASMPSFDAQPFGP